MRLRPITRDELRRKFPLGASVVFSRTGDVIGTVCGYGHIMAESTHPDPEVLVVYHKVDHKIAPSRKFGQFSVRCRIFRRSWYETHQ